MASRIATLFLLVVLSLHPLAGRSAGPQDGPAEDKVVYHLSDGLEQAANGLRNVQNHLEVNPKAKIIIVAHAKGVDYLMDGAQDKNGNPFNIVVEELKAKGVEFDVCEITLKRRQIDRSKFIPEVSFVPSGVAETARLQQREGYAYIKP